MSSSHPLGPNHAAVAAFLAELPAIPWFTTVGAPPDRPEARFVDFHYLAERFEDPWSGWGEALIAAEAAIERLEFDNHRLTYHAAVQQAYDAAGFLPNRGVDDLFQRVTTDHRNPETGYYRDTHMHPYELIDFPHRLVRGAALERMVADLDPGVSFFAAQMQWFRLGRWPVGWDGRWPDGRVVLW